MRYTGSNGNDRYNPAGRPPQESLPADVAKLVTEYDAAVLRVREAEREREHLAHHDRDEEARQADAGAAATAARAGKKIPPASATAKLASDRDEATRAVDAYNAAVKAIRNDLDEACEVAAPTIQPTDADRQHVDQAAADLAAVLERTIAARATYDWLRGRPYEPASRTWAVDVAPVLKNHGIRRDNGTLVTARAVVTNLVSALMED